MVKKIIQAVLMMVMVVSAFEYFTAKVISETKPTIRVGSKSFTENIIVGEIYALALENAGYKVERKFNIPNKDIHNSIVNDEIDLYPEYTGTGLFSILKLDLITDPQAVYDTVKSEYDNRFNLVWLNYSALNDSQGIVIRTDVAKKFGIRNISDLKEHASKLRFVTQGEFDVREDGLPRLEEIYGDFNLKSAKVRVYTNNSKYNMLLYDEADFAPAYTTEAQLLKDEFTILEDDKKAWPPYNLAPVIRKQVLNANPEIADILNKVSATLDTKKAIELNAVVDLDRRSYKEVAKEYYESIKQKIAG